MIAANGHKGQALIYCRVSTRGQEEDGTSLGSQADACVKHAQENGYIVGRVTREVYSGAELWDRPKLAQDRADLKAGEFQALVAYATDRLSRDPIHLAIIADECERAGVELVFVTEPLDGSDEGMLIQYVKGYAAKIERQKIRERGLRGKMARLKSGKLHNYGYELYGYRRDKEAGVRLIYEPEAAMVRRIFSWYVEEGAAIHEIARRLTASVPAPTTEKRVIDPSRPPKWGTRTVQNILLNAAYKGETIAWKNTEIRRGKFRQIVPRPVEEHIRLPEGTTPALVSEALWDVAQERLATNRGASTRNKTHPRLLRGLVVCAVCGRVMNGATGRGKFLIYRCPSRRLTGRACGSSQVPANDVPTVKPRGGKDNRWIPVDAELRSRLPVRLGVEAWAWQQVAAILRDPSIIAAELRRRQDEGPDPVLIADLEGAKRTVAAITSRQQRLLALYTDGDSAMPLELIKQQLATAEREKEQWCAMIRDLEARIADQQRTVEQLGALTAYCERVGTNLERFTFAERRLALEALGIRVIANGRNWRLDGSIPLDSSAVTLSTFSSHRKQSDCLRFSLYSVDPMEGAAPDSGQSLPGTIESTPPPVAV